MYLLVHLRAHSTGSKTLAVVKKILPVVAYIYIYQEQTMVAPC
jgi:hypothetical protein